MTNDSAIIYATDSSLIQINGSLNNIGDTFTNNGLTIIKGHLVNCGQTRGSGTYEVDSNWINNKLNYCGTSTVKLTGNEQLITGTEKTIFYNLFLNGIPASVKRQTIDSEVMDSLDLQDHELATDSFKMFVSNPNLNVIQRTSGFVSSLGSGRLLRATNINGAYLYPVGSSLNTLRYRPVVLTPESSSANTYAIRLANNNATIDSYDVNIIDDSLCTVNPNFYHLIDRVSGTDASKIKIYYESSTDGSYTSIAHWDYVPSTKWHITELNNIANSDAIMNYVSTSNNWNDYVPDPFILGTKRTLIHNLDSTATCVNNTADYSIEDGPSDNNYVWIVTGGEIIGDSTSKSVTIKWDSAGVGTISVYHNGANDSIKCNSNTLSKNVIIFPTPTATFTTNPINDISVYQLIYFANNSNGGNNYLWDFGDGNTSNDFNAKHKYDEMGNYTITLITKDLNGCYDTTYQIIEILGNSISPPNTFTPNDDGFNDEFKIKYKGEFKEFRMEIFNRWGNKLFETTNINIGWDGFGYPSGTYYYIIFAKTFNEKEYKYNGSLTLVR